MKVGVFLQVADPERGEAVSVADLVARARRVEELGFDSVWVMDHFFSQWPERRIFVHDPMVQLAAMAAATTRVELGPLVLGAPFRNPIQLAREAATLQDLSGGRLRLGVGAGWFEPEFQAAQIPFDHLATRFEGYLERLLPALRERGSTPPLWIGASGPRMLGLAARHADAWNFAWGGRDTRWFEDLVKQLRAALAQAGRPESAVSRSAGVSALPVEGAEAERARERARRFARQPRDLNYVEGGPPELAAAIRAYGDAGAEHVILNLSSSPGVLGDDAYIERAAEALALAR